MYYMSLWSRLQEISKITVPAGVKNHVKLFDVLASVSSKAAHGKEVVAVVESPNALAVDIYQKGLETHINANIWRELTHRNAEQADYNLN